MKRKCSVDQKLFIAKGQNCVSVCVSVCVCGGGGGGGGGGGVGGGGDAEILPLSPMKIPVVQPSKLIFIFIIQE